jgi:hypothetical protein
VKGQLGPIVESDGENVAATEIGAYRVADACEVNLVVFAESVDHIGEIVAGKGGAVENQRLGTAGESDVARPGPARTGDLDGRTTDRRATGETVGAGENELAASFREQLPAPLIAPDSVTVPLRSTISPPSLSMLPDRLPVAPRCQFAGWHRSQSWST